MLIILLPSILALVTFGKSPCSAISNDLNPSCASATSLSLVGELGSSPNDPSFLPAWYYPVGVVTSSLYAAGNAVISGLLLLNLSKVHRGVARSSLASRLGRPMTALFLFVETGMLLFVGQVVNLKALVSSRSGVPWSWFTYVQVIIDLCCVMADHERR